MWIYLVGQFEIVFQKRVPVIFLHFSPGRTVLWHGIAYQNIDPTEVFDRGFDNVAAMLRAAIVCCCPPTHGLNLLNNLIDKQLWVC